MAFALFQIGRAVFLCAEKYEGETTTRFKKRRRARKDYLQAKSGQALSDRAASDMWDGLLSEMHIERGHFEGMREAVVSRAGTAPTALRAVRSVRLGVYGGGVRLSAEIPSAIRQLRAKDVLTDSEVALIVRFRGDYDLAYYSSPGLTTNYGGVGGGGSASAVGSARAAVIDARARMRCAEQAMTAGCWDVLVKMATMDIAQVNVGGTTERYKDPKARRYAAGILLIEALAGLAKIYG